MWAQKVPYSNVWKFNLYVKQSVYLHFTVVWLLTFFKYELLFNYPDWNQRLNIAISSYKYGDSHDKDKTVPWWSSYLNNDNSIVGKASFWHGSGILPEIPSVSETIYECCHMHPFDNSCFLGDFHALCCRSRGALHAGKFGHRIGMQVIVF